MYVPRDECFSEVKQRKLGEETASSLLHALNPSLWRRIIGFPNLAAIDQLFDEGMESPPRGYISVEQFLIGKLHGIFITVWRFIGYHFGYNLCLWPFKAPQPMQSQLSSLPLSSPMHLYMYTKYIKIVTKFYCLSLGHDHDTLFSCVGDRFFWLRDEEFVRQTLAGINPYAIKLVTV